VIHYFLLNFAKLIFVFQENLAGFHRIIFSFPLETLNLAWKYPLICTGWFTVLQNDLLSVITEKECTFLYVKKYVDIMSQFLQTSVKISGIFWLKS